jgi:GH24 family phage-related lysozyme (muramidase)
MFTASLIRRHEGLRLEAYKDIVGKLTVGYGFNLDAGAAKAICASLNLDYESIRNGAAITEAQADAILDLQLGMVNAQAKTLFPNFNQMPADVQAVVQDLIFNMGFAAFSKFGQTVPALRAGKYAEAADFLEKDKWFRETGHRGVEDVALLRGSAIAA